MHGRPHAPHLRPALPASAGEIIRRPSLDALGPRSDHEQGAAVAVENTPA